MTCTRRAALSFVLALAASAPLSGLALAQQAPAKIGAVFSVTGPASFLGDPSLKTIQYYVEQINAAGGVLGRKLELVSYDDGSEASKANGFAKRLIDDDKVEVIIGPSTTGSTMSMIPLVEKAGVPMISISGGVGIIEPVKKWVFKTPHTDRMAAEKVFTDMKKRGLTKVALLSETSGFGVSGRKETLGVAEKHGITIVADETYGPKDTDVTAQLTKIKGLGTAQAIFVFGLGQGPAVVTKNYAQLGVTAPLYQSHGVASDEYIKLSGPAADGVRLPAAALLVANKLPDNDIQKKVVTDYAKAFTERYKSEVSTFGGDTYNALMLYVEAVKRAGSFDRAKVRDEIEKTKGLVGTSGVITMSATDHLGLDLSAFRMLEVRKGEWTLVD